MIWIFRASPSSGDMVLLSSLQGSYVHWAVFCRCVLDGVLSLCVDVGLLHVRLLHGNCMHGKALPAKLHKLD